ncbi:hypothetical protein AB0H43_24510 [Hamadaea sp. NPDC050747]|uniref:hypothetical protein n=1 Tax=Hamadaea sp. NPDC050747 TaxID=3155789 RepID=UPI0033EEC914
MRRLLAVAASSLATGLLMGTPAFAAAGSTATATVTASPETVRPGGTTTVTAGCGSDATSATLSAQAVSGSSQVGMKRAPDSSGPGAYAAEVTVPDSTLPGTYQLKVWCSTGEAGTGTLVVAPNGAPTTGDGSTASGGTHRAVALAGVVLAVSAAAGLVLTRRRGDARQGS